MKTAATVALAVVGTVAVAGVGYGGYQALNDEGPYAEVVKVEPATKTWQEPNQRCEQVTVQRQKPVKDKHQIAGSAIGAVVGGVIGHQFGGGSGKDVATAAGAVAGGYAGNKAQERIQEGNTYTTTEERCQTIMETRSEQVGYNVTYRFDGQTQTVRMENEPGDRLPLVDPLDVDRVVEVLMGFARIEKVRLDHSDPSRGSATTVVPASRSCTPRPLAGSPTLTTSTKRNAPPKAPSATGPP